MEWDKGYSYLVKFFEQNGHAIISTEYIAEDDFDLGKWVGTQRSKKCDNDLTLDQVRRLEEMKGWSWDQYAGTDRKVYGYIISPEKRDAGIEMSLNVQEQLIRSFADYRNFTIENIFKELDVPASVEFTKRPQGKKLLEVIKSRDTVFCSTLDRIGKHKEFEDKKVTLFSAEFGLELRDKRGTFKYYKDENFFG